MQEVKRAARETRWGEKRTREYGNVLYHADTCSVKARYTLYPYLFTILRPEVRRRGAQTLAHLQESNQEQNKTQKRSGQQYSHGVRFVNFKTGTMKL